eukprot:6384596-Amphidinium_carterae.1
MSGAGLSSAVQAMLACRPIDTIWPRLHSSKSSLSGVRHLIQHKDCQVLAFIVKYVIDYLSRWTKRTIFEFSIKKKSTAMQAKSRVVAKIRIWSVAVNSVLWDGTFSEL